MSAGRWCAGALCAIAGCGQIDFGVARTDGGTGVGADARTDGPIGPSVARDLTGDGRPDLVVASTTSIHVFAGGPGFAPADEGDATTTLSLTGAAALLTNLVALGDVTGDGVAELFVTTEAAGLIRLHRIVGPLPPGTVALLDLATSTDLSTNGVDSRVVGSLGDLTGDGRVDLAVTVGTVEGEILVFTSGAIDGPPHARIGLPTGANEPSAPSRLRDLTGDGQDDLVVGNRYRAPAGRGAVDVIPGPIAAGARTASELEAEANVVRVRTTIDTELLGSGVGLADVDHDGAVDLVVGADQASGAGVSAGHTLVLLGPLAAGTVDAASAARARIVGRPGDQVGNRIVTGFDGDGDGRADLLTIGWCGVACSGAVLGVAGLTLDRTYLPTDVTFRLDGDSGDDHFGITASLVGDLDGDGVDDLAVGVARTNPAPGVVYLLRGGRVLPASGTAGVVADRIITGGPGFGAMVIGAD